MHSMVFSIGIFLHEGNFLNVTQNGFDKQFNINLNVNYLIAQVFLKDKFWDKSA